MQHDFFLVPLQPNNLVIVLQFVTIQASTIQLRSRDELESTLFGKRSALRRRSSYSRDTMTTSNRPDVSSPSNDARIQQTSSPDENGFQQERDINGKDKVSIYFLADYKVSYYYRIAKKCSIVVYSI